MPQFAVGDKAWYAKCQWEPIRQTCPTCFGKKEVTLILGNGESVLLPCGGCSPGYELPTGYISVYDYVVKPEPITITSMNIEINGDREKVTYYSGSYCFDDLDVFPTEEEARIKAEAKKKKLDEDQRTRVEYIKKNVHKSFTWNAHYHIREAKRHKKEALYHEEKARLCKERANKDDDALLQPF